MVDSQIEIDPDIQELANKLAFEVLYFIRNSGNKGVDLTIHRWLSLKYALAEPIQKMRNYTKEVA